MERKEYSLLLELGAKMNENFNGTFSSAQKILAKTQKEIQSFSRLQGDISGYEKQQSAISELVKKQQGYEKSLERVKTQKKELEKLQKDYSGKSDSKYDDVYFLKELNNLSEREAALKRNLDKATDGIEKQKKSAEELKNKLREAGVNTDDLSGSSKELADKMETLKKQEEDAADAAAELGDRSVGTFELIEGQIVQSGLNEILKELAGAYKECISLAAGFNGTMSKVEALSGASAVEMSELTGKAKELGATTKFTATEAAEAMTYMGMAGWNAQQMISGMDGVLMLAAASGEDLGTVSDIVTDDLTAFGLSAKDAGHFADVLAAASTSSNTNVGLMGETFKYVAPLFGTMNWSAEDAAVAVGLMANAGIKGTQAGTSLKTAIANLISPSEKMREKMDELGISMENVKSFSEVQTMLRSSFAGLSEQEQAAAASVIFGKEAMSGMLNIINASQTDIDKLTNAISDCDGAAKQMSETMLDNLSGQMTLLSSASDALKVTIGDAFKDELASLAKIGTKILTDVNTFAEKNPVMVKSIIALGAELLALVSIYPMYIGYKKAKVAVDTISNVLKAASVKLTKKSTAAKIEETVATQGTTAAQQGLNAAMSANPVGLILLGLSVLTPVIIGIVDKIKKAKAETEALTEHCREMTETFETANETFEQTRTQIEGQTELAERYISQLERLEAQGVRTREEKEAYALVVERLNSLYPDLNAKIDAETGLLENGTRALREYTEAWKEAKFQEALQSKYGDEQQAYTDAEVELYQNKAKLKLAEDEYNELVKKEKELWSVSQEKLNSMDFDNPNVYNTAEYEAYRKANQAYVEAHEKVKENEKQQKKLKNSIKDSTEALEEKKKALEESKAALDLYNESLSETGETLSATDYVGRVTSKLEALKTAYDTAYKSAYDSIKGQFKLWDEATSEAMNVDDVTAKIETQIAYWENYNRDLASLSARNVEGLAELVTAHSSGSKEDVNFIAGLAKASDGQIKALIEAIGLKDAQLEKTAGGMATVSEEFLKAKEAYEENFEEIKDTLNIADEAKNAAEEAMNAYIAALRRGEGNLRAVMNEISFIVSDGMYAGRGKGKNGGYVSLPMYASGTDNASAGLALVGERGPELVSFGGGETVYDAEKTRRYLVDMNALSALVYTSQRTAGAGVNIRPTERGSVTRNYNISISPKISVEGSEAETRIAEDIETLVYKAIMNIEEDRMRGDYI